MSSASYICIHTTRGKYQSYVTNPETKSVTIKYMCTLRTIEILSRTTRNGGELKGQRSGGLR